MVYMYHSFLIHSSADGHLGCFHVLAMINSFSHEFKRHLLLGRKAMTNLDSVFKRRDITLPTKVHRAKAMIFPTVVYRCESWTIKNAEHWRINAFELCWRKLLRVPWTGRSSNQSILKLISPEYSLEGLVLKLKLQSFGQLIQRADSLEKTLMLGKIEDRRRRGRQRMRWLEWHHQFSGHERKQTPWDSEGQERLEWCSPQGHKESDITERLNNSKNL